MAAGVFPGGFMFPAKGMKGWAGENFWLIRALLAMPLFLCSAGYSAVLLVRKRTLHAYGVAGSGRRLGLLPHSPVRTNSHRSVDNLYTPSVRFQRWSVPRKLMNPSPVIRTLTGLIGINSVNPEYETHEDREWLLRRTAAKIFFAPREDG